MAGGMTYVCYDPNASYSIYQMTAEKSLFNDPGNIQPIKLTSLALPTSVLEVPLVYYTCLRLGGLRS